jgi:uncharacterized protein (DUF4213/DUF364 family)
VKILDDLMDGLAGAPAREVRVGRFWTAVWSRHCGLASTTGPGEHKHGSRFVQGAGSLAGQSALELARLAHSESTLEAGIGLAAINSLLEVDETRCVERNAGDLLVERGRDKRVALIAGGILPQADVVAITGSAFINHSLEGLLGLCRTDAFIVVLGPTTPLSPVLFDYGVNAISGTRVVDPELALRSVSEGATFRQIQGIRLLTMER